MTARVLPRLPDAVLRDQVKEGAEDLPSELQVTLTAHNALIPIIYGRQRVGALIFAVGAFNNRLYLGCLWCAGPVEAIESVTINDEEVDWGVDDYDKHDYVGAVGQGVDSWLAQAVSGYSSTMTMLVGGVQVPMCYSVIECQQNDNGFPQVQAIIKGRKVYDPRTAAWGYSQNPALCLADWITNATFGQGLTVDWDSVTAAANYCDEDLGGGHKRRQLDLVLANELPVAQWTDILRAYAGCYIAHDGTKLRLVPDKDTTAARALTASNIVAGSLQLSRLSEFDRATVYEVSFTDTRSLPWKTATARATLTGVDAGTRSRAVSSITMPGITRAKQAYREALERLAIDYTTDLEATWETFDEGAADLIGDIVTLTHPIGLTAEAFRIVDVVLVSPGRWQVQARQHNASIYSNDITATDTDDFTDLPDPGDIPAPTGITAASGTAYLLVANDGTIVSRIYVTWTIPATYLYARRAEVQFKRVTDSTWQTAATVDQTSAFCSSVQDGETYDLRVRIVNSLGQTGEWGTAQHVVVGKTEPPPDVTTFSVSAYGSGTRQFTWTMASPPPDLAGYKLRWVLGSSGSWATMTDLHTGIQVASPYETDALAGGEYTFAIKAVDTSGNESVTAQYITVTLPDQPMSGLLTAVDCYADGWSGTKTNCWVAADGFLYATDSKTWASLLTDGVTWATWTAWARDANDLTYTHTALDLGAVLTFTPTVSANCPVGTLTLEERTSNDGSSWSSWATCATAVKTARYYQARATVAGTAGQQLRLLNMSIQIGADPLEEVIEDLATSSLSGSYDLGVGNVRLPITEPFTTITGVFVTLQSTGAGWSWELIDKDTTTGPQIKIYNASNTLADATIDALIRGY
jgi:hypothetical protein